MACKSSIQRKWYRSCVEPTCTTKAGGTAEFQLADPGSPTMIRDGKDMSALYVLMPMRV